jgi:uncharacterized membrane protein YfcA
MGNLSVFAHSLIGFFMDIISLFVIYLVGTFAGIFGTLVGGGGLITVPTLIFIGLSPHVAIATSRMGAVGLFSAGWYKFHKKGTIDYRVGLITGIPFFIGSILGAFLLLEIGEESLRKIIAVFTVMVLIIIVAKSNIGLEKRKDVIRKHELILGIVLSFFIGVYAGFYTPGFGIFLSYVQILLFGQTFIESAGTWKIGAVMYSVVTSVIFAFEGLIVYPDAVALFIGTASGSYVGAHYSDRIGNVWVRRLFIIAVLALALKLVI